MVTTSTFVQTSANVVRVTELKPNDVYKRLVKGYGDDYKMHIGVVTDVLNNGDDTAITAIEFEPERYSGGKPVESKVFGATNDLALFSTTPEEVALFLDRVRERLDAETRTKQQELEALHTARVSLENIAVNVDGGKLTAPATSQEALSA